MHERSRQHAHYEPPKILLMSVAKPQQALDQAHSDHDGYQ